MYDKRCGNVLPYILALFGAMQVEIGTPITAITACPVQGNQIGIMAINIYCNVSRTNSRG
jgi:hypothetical protein